jgi:hypothetical protein
MCENNSYLCAILDRDPSAKHEFAVHVSHFVLIVRDWVKFEKLLWHCWQEMRKPLIQLTVFEAPGDHRRHRSRDALPR